MTIYSVILNTCMWIIVPHNGLIFEKYAVFGSYYSPYVNNYNLTKQAKQFFSGVRDYKVDMTNVYFTDPNDVLMYKLIWS